MQWDHAIEGDRRLLQGISYAHDFPTLGINGPKVGPDKGQVGGLHESEESVILRAVLIEPC